MPWFAWLIIWTALGLALLTMLGVAAWRLFQKATGILDDLDSLLDQLAAVTENIEELTAPASENAILVGYAEQSARREALVQHRTRVKDLRREQRLLRGKILVSANPLEGRNRAR
jgi:hypothetical protein